ncbi:MAG: methionyl-tRNA formyltransferase, partial [Bacteroidales bacterium]
VNPPPAKVETITFGEVMARAPRIFPEDCTINWDNEPGKIHNFIRGLAPYPGSRSVFRNGKNLSVKIFESQPEAVSHSYKPGQIISDGKNFIKVACEGGFVKVLNLQLEGKSRMNCEEFLRGFRIADYSIIVS